MYSKYLRSFILLFFGTVLSNSLISYSDGPPTARTGAPGELSCYNGYCHNSFPLNSGPAESSLLIDAPEGVYTPGKIYQISPKILSPGMQRFGFQLQALNRESSMASGIFSNLEENLQQIRDQELLYITHELAKVAEDSADWKMDWQAPPAGSGPVDFYVAFVAANNNANRSGDYVYTRKISLEENIQTNVLPDEKLKIGAYPTVFDKKILISIKTTSSKPIEISIYNLNGQEVFYDSRALIMNDFAYEKEITTANWASGLYIVNVTNGKQKWMKKVIKE